jgi:hypothetical protein
MPAARSRPLRIQLNLHELILQVQIMSKLVDGYVHVASGLSGVKKDKAYKDQAKLRGITNCLHNVMDELTRGGEVLLYRTIAGG